MTVSIMAKASPKLLYSAPDHRRLNPATRLKGGAKFLIDAKNRSLSSSFQRPLRIQALESKTDDENPSLEEPTASFIPREDSNYLWKLGAGSFVAAAIIKYGSMIFPEITRPNIVLALVMISTPVIVAVLLLLKQSRVEQ